MRILYGVQATGQGHISRARAMAEAFKRHDVEITWMFSGRPKHALFDMEPFVGFEHRRGLTFAAQAGRVRYRATVLENNLLEFRRDVTQLDTSHYDMIITDFEPVVAWAARRSGRNCIGLGHQYAFGAQTPVCGDNWIGRTIMRRFAPVSIPIGFHWHRYANNVLPPILDLPPLHTGKGGYVLVYLPFEDQQIVTRLLQQLAPQRFVQYADIDRVQINGNVRLMPKSTETFKKDLSLSDRVICNSGFELISECLQWGKPVLTLPLAGQMEQLSNAMSLQQLGYAHVSETLSRAELGAWLETPGTTADIHYPDVARALANWLVYSFRTTPQVFAGTQSPAQAPPISRLASSLWRESVKPHVHSHNLVA